MGMFREVITCLLGRTAPAVWGAPSYSRSTAGCGGARNGRRFDDSSDRVFPCTYIEGQQQAQEVAAVQRMHFWRRGPRYGQGREGACAECCHLRNARHRVQYLWVSSADRRKQVENQCHMR